MAHNKESLKQLVEKEFDDYKFVIVSNRQPFSYSIKNGKTVENFSSGGLVTALDPVMRACNGLWVCSTTGDADCQVADSSGKISVPKSNPKYTQKFLKLSEKEVDGYYNGYANQALWPLCHHAYRQPVFLKEEWNIYKKVNQRFAQSIIEEVGDSPVFVWIQDYHFCLLPTMLRKHLKNNAFIAHFWHIPWPNFEMFRICPQKNEILKGLLDNDLIGFHTHHHCDNFINVIQSEMECRVGLSDHFVQRKGHKTIVNPYPISVDYGKINKFTKLKSNQTKAEKLVEEFGLKGKKILLGIDRIDYTKGIPERLMALDQLLKNHPELIGEIVLLQMGPETRIEVQRYKSFREDLDALVEKINKKYRRGDWEPIRMIPRKLDFQEVLLFYMMTDVCIVSSLHDGMNLVAKEFVTANRQKQGMLVLSRFTGVARELTDAVLINPYDSSEFANGIYEALNMPEDEKVYRIGRMKQIVQKNTVFDWAANIILDMKKFNFLRED